MLNSVGCKKYYLACAGLLLFILILAFGYSLELGYLFVQQMQTDERVLYISGWLLDHGRDPYYNPQVAQVLYPGTQREFLLNLNLPFVTMLVAISSKLVSAPSFSIIFWSSNLLAGLLSIWLLVQYFSRQYRLLIFLSLTAFAFASVSSICSVIYGSFALILSFLFICSFILYDKKMYGLAGAVLGLAFSIKLFFGLFIFLFLAQKRYRAFAGFVLCALLTALIPLLWYGFFPYVSFFKLLRTVDWYAISWNASYYGVLCRIFGDPTGKFESVWSLSFLSQALYYVIFFSYVVLIVRISTRLKSRADYSYSIVVISALLLSPLGWFYYFPLLLLGLVSYLREIQYRSNFYIYFLVITIFLLCVNMPFGMNPAKEASLTFQLTMANYLFIALMVYHLVQIYLFCCSKEVLQHDGSHFTNYKLWIMVFSVLFFMPAIYIFIFNKMVYWAVLKKQVIVLFDYLV